MEIFSYLFATMLIVGANYKFWRIMSAKKTVDYPVWVFIIPSVVMVCGIVLFAVGIQIVQQWLALIVGIAFIGYSLHSLLDLSRLPPGGVTNRCTSRMTKSAPILCQCRSCSIQHVVCLSFLPTLWRRRW